MRVWVDIRSNGECEENMEDNHGAITQEPTPSEIFVKASIQEETGKPEIEVIPDLNLEVLVVTCRRSKST